MLLRSVFFTACSLFVASSAHAVSIGQAKDLLLSVQDTLSECSEERAAVNTSLAHLSDIELPISGDYALVNIPRGVLTVFEDHQIKFEMKVIVGKAENPTPVFSSTISSVRLNPTWTVPESIIEEENWYEKLQTDPDFFIRNKFEFRNKDYELIPLEEAMMDPTQVEKWIQSPGENNALGSYRFNVLSSESIYLHDTRDRENFYDGSPITLSHGCVRLENPKKFANWLLDLDEKKVDAFVRSGSSFDLPVRKEMPIFISYLPAWPGDENTIYIHDDIYNKNINCNTLQIYSEHSK